MGMGKYKAGIIRIRFGFFSCRMFPAYRIICSNNTHMNKYNGFRTVGEMNQPCSPYSNAGKPLSSQSSHFEETNLVFEVMNKIIQQ
jgi:hypothetical protein